MIQPSNSDVVYVPQYNPAMVYGYPYVTPGYSAADVIASSALSFGAGVALGAFAGGAWGWPAWGMNWAGGAVVYNHRAFYGNAAWLGGYIGGYHPYRFDGGYHPYGDSFNRNEFNRNVSNFNRSNVQNFTGSHFSDANSWAHHDNWAGRSSAFSDFGHRGGFGGWSSRADSMRAGGFGGFHGGFGGFHGGGRR